MIWDYLWIVKLIRMWFADEMVELWKCQVLHTMNMNMIFVKGMKKVIFGILIWKYGFVIIHVWMLEKIW